MKHRIEFVDVVLALSAFALIGLVSLFGLAACCSIDNTGSTPQTQQQQTTHKEEAVIHYEQLPAIVTSVDKKQWFATIMRRNVSVKVYNATYGIEKTIDEECNGMWLSSEFDTLWNLKEDDTVVVKVYYYVLPSTGQRVSKPKISSIVYQ